MTEPDRERLHGRLVDLQGRLEVTPRDDRKARRKLEKQIERVRRELRRRGRR
jgi:hypothetical protein